VREDTIQGMLKFNLPKETYRKPFGKRVYIGFESQALKVSGINISLLRARTDTEWEAQTDKDE
jgi:hypothetical protein